MKHLLPTLALLLFLLCGLSACKTESSTTQEGEADTIPVCTLQFCADSAYAHIEKQCDFGPRVPNSAAHDDCAAWIATQFRARGLEVVEQRADLTAWDHKVLHAVNIIAQYRPEVPDRILICTHWESRPWADADPDTANHHQPVLAANDGASGVGVMLELARLLPELAPEYGIDFICFDAEDYGVPYWASEQAPDDGSDWCMGSRHFARHPHRPDYAPRYGILLDMVGGDDARFHYEGFSLRYAQRQTLRLWSAAATAGFDHLFKSKEGGWATDDHVPLNEILGVPTLDVIPFTSAAHSFGATWHTINDTPAHISRETLRGVGQSLLQLLFEETLSPQP